MAKSWNHCWNLGADPSLKTATLRDDIDELIDGNERLLRAAGPVLLQLVDALDGSGYVVAITDVNGNILDCAGEHGACRRLARADFAPGCDLSEAAAGTNAIGTAIADRRALQLLAGEHFCDSAQLLTCTAGPIYAARTRDIVGVLDITADYKLARGI